MGRSITSGGVDTRQSTDRPRNYGREGLDWVGIGHHSCDLTIFDGEDVSDRRIDGTTVDETAVDVHDHHDRMRDSVGCRMRFEGGP